MSVRKKRKNDNENEKSSQNQELGYLTRKFIVFAWTKTTTYWVGWLCRWAYWMEGVIKSCEIVNICPVWEWMTQTHSDEGQNKIWVDEQGTRQKNQRLNSRFAAWFPVGKSWNGRIQSNTHDTTLTLLLTWWTLRSASYGKVLSHKFGPRKAACASTFQGSPSSLCLSSPQISLLLFVLPENRKTIINYRFLLQKCFYVIDKTHFFFTILILFNYFHIIFHIFFL